MNDHRPVHLAGSGARSGKGCRLLGLLLINLLTLASDHGVNQPGATLMPNTSDCVGAMGDKERN